MFSSSVSLASWVRMRRPRIFISRYYLSREAMGMSISRQRRDVVLFFASLPIRAKREAATCNGRRDFVNCFSSASRVFLNRILRTTRPHRAACAPAGVFLWHGAGNRRRDGS